MNRLASLVPVFLAVAPLLASAGEFDIRVIDAKTQLPLAARMHLKDSRGKPVKPPKTIYWHDHFIIPGTVGLSLRPGTYTFELECGPEYKLRTGHFAIERSATDNTTVEMVRFVDMKSEGWWSGDLHVHRPVEDIELLMKAEDLHVAPLITWWNKTNLWESQPLPHPATIKFDTDRYYNLLAGEDERGGGALLFFNLNEPLDIAGASKEYPSSLEFLKAAKAAGDRVHVDAEKPFWWDFPAWVASGQIDSVGIAHNHLQRNGLLKNEAWGRARDMKLYPDPSGIGRYTLDIYYHLLNCGLRIPPSAGSASGVLPNPVGYNRVYVHCGDEFDYDQWFAGLKAGRVVITNGPMLRPLVNGKLPGHVFTADAGETVTLDIGLSLSLREKVDYLEIVQNGKVVHEVRLDQFAQDGGKLPPLKFDQSGWMLVRAVTNHPETFRFAMTGPYYVEIGYEKRISKASAQFFLDWVYDRARQIQLEDGAEQAAVMAYHRAARDYWQKLVDSANAE
jgi:hypothetical protein